MFSRFAWLVIALAFGVASPCAELPSQHSSGDCRIELARHPDNESEQRPARGDKQRAASDGLDVLAPLMQPEPVSHAGVAESRLEFSEPGSILPLCIPLCFLARLF